MKFFYSMNHVLSVQGSKFKVQSSRFKVQPEKCTDQAKNVLRRLASTRESGIVTPRQ
jgi:hypothetical protein